MDSEQEAKRVKLTIPQQNQGATPVDPENAPGKRSELEPIQGGEIANLQNDGPAEAGASNAASGSAPLPAKVRVQGEGE